MIKKLRRSKYIKQYYFNSEYKTQNFKNCSVKYGIYGRKHNISKSLLAITTQIFFELQVIAEGCHENGIGIVKINDVEEAEEFGLTEMPVVVLFENQVPSVFTGNIEDEDEVLVRQ
jgi:hypothetical protein